MVPKHAKNLVNSALKDITAYRKFLQENNYHNSKIRTSKDFEKLPITSKKSYLMQSTQQELMWPKAYNSPLSYSSTSGSTGEPYYFPRDDKLAWQASLVIEDFMSLSSYGRGRTLVLVGFGMGVWIGGVFTVRQFEIAAERKKLPLSILPIGYNKKEMFKALKKLAPQYDQVIIAGYPPFIKEIIDESENEGIDLKAIKLRLLFAAESFSETFRNYVCEHAGIKNPDVDTMNIYGTADIGAMAYETPLSILVRRLALENPLLFRDLFGQFEKTPTLAQYNEKFMYFEEIEGKVVLTGNGALPLIRYSIGDNGGVRTYEQIKHLFSNHDVDLDKLISGRQEYTFSKKRPFVFVYERADMSVLLQGIIIYPEFVKEALLMNELAPTSTQRFTMATKTDVRHNQFLSINVELQSSAKGSPALTKEFEKIIHKILIAKSSEYSEVAKTKKSSGLIKVTLWPKDSPRYFSPGVKQKWVEKA